MVGRCQSFGGMCRFNLQDRRVILLLIHSYPPPSLPHTFFLHLHFTSCHCITVIAECHSFSVLRSEFLSVLPFHKLLHKSLFSTLDFSVWNIEAARSSDMVVSSYQFRRRHNTAGSSIRALFRLHVAFMVT